MYQVKEEKAQDSAGCEFNYSCIYFNTNEGGSNLQQSLPELKSESEDFHHKPDFCKNDIKEEIVFDSENDKSKFKFERRSLKTDTDNTIYEPKQLFEEVKLEVSDEYEHCIPTACDISCSKEDASSDKQLPESLQLDCDICGKYFHSKRNLRIHLLTHTSIKPFQCDICNKSFSLQSRLVTHKYTHSGYRPFQCDLCNKSFSQRSGLKAHKATHAGNRPFICEICNKSFNQKYCLNVHKVTHTGERPYQCQICNKSFRQKSALHAHVFGHSGSRPFECDICNKSFSRKWHLNDHMGTHKGNGLKCEECGKCFSLNVTLRRHKLIHADSSQFECEICSRTFSLRRYLIAHNKITHSDSRPFQCEICKKSFSRKETLTKHMNTHSSTIPVD